MHERRWPIGRRRSGDRSPSERKAAAGGSRRSASLVGPATVFVPLGLLVPIAILFRYSLNQFVPGQLMVEALTLENYVKFFTDPYYTDVLLRRCGWPRSAPSLCLVLGFPLAYVLARTQSRFKNLLIMLVVLPLFVGNAVRAAGWMTLFGTKGSLNVTLMQLGVIDRAAADHVHRGRRHRSASSPSTCPTWC